MDTDKLIKLEDHPYLPQELKTELIHLEEERHIQALTNLLKRRTPSRDIKIRKVRGGHMAPYLTGSWFIAQANDLFAHCWSFEIHEQGIDSKHAWVRGSVTVTTPDKVVEIEHPDGTVERRRTEGMTITKYQYGGHDISKDSDTKEDIDKGDSLKSAATDCLKKCLTLFGIAADVYGSKEEKKLRMAEAKVEQERETKFRAIYNVGSEMGWDEARVKEWVASTQKKPLEQFVSEKELLNVLKAIRKEEEKQNANKEPEEDN